MPRLRKVGEIWSPKCSGDFGSSGSGIISGKGSVVLLQGRRICIYLYSLYIYICDFHWHEELESVGF